MFELFDDKGTVKIAEEKHYELVPYESITASDLSAYRNIANA